MLFHAVLVFIALYTLIYSIYFSYCMYGVTACSWLDVFFWIGYKRELKQEDLYATPEEGQSQHLLDHFNKLGCYTVYAFSCTRL